MSLKKQMIKEIKIGGEKWLNNTILKCSVVIVVISGYNITTRAKGYTAQKNALIANVGRDTNVGRDPRR